MLNPSKIHPSFWTIIKIKMNENEKVAVMAGSHGGYAGSDTWRISSSIVEAKKTKDEYCFKTESGSEYICYKTNEKMTMYMSSIFENYKSRIEENDGSMEIIPVKVFLKSFNTKTK